jgi:putative spermidine/putrescine transport system ATP-binding protein
MFPLRMRGFPRREFSARAEKMLQLVGLGAFAGRYPRELSGGQQQRVALARGLVFNPDVLLLDEPLGALDKNLREQMQVEIKRIHREVGITMIYVTHDQTEAMTMSDRIAVFSDGRLEQVGAPLEVYNRPVNRFVGEFIGDSNFLPGRIDPAQPNVVEIAGIGRAQVAPAGGTPAGNVLVLIRPERLRAHAGGPNDNALDMVIDETINYGDSVLAIGTSHGIAVRARQAGRDGEAMRRGETVKLYWSPTDAHIIGGK